jgi:hypothetical protein
MAAPAQLTWDITPPRRPSLGDVGGATLQDHASKPPDKATMPYPDQLNQWAKQIERLAACSPVAVISVQFTAGVPSVELFTAMRTTLTIGDFTVDDNGNGDTTITWPANTFPPPVARPSVTVNEFHPFLTPTVANVANGVRVKTYDNAGVATDVNFTVTVY